MKITIEGMAEDVSRFRLATYLRYFNKRKTIKFKMNGIKFEGQITRIVYKNKDSFLGINKFRIIEIQLVTI